MYTVLFWVRPIDQRKLIGLSHGKIDAVKCTKLNTRKSNASTTFLSPNIIFLLYHLRFIVKYCVFIIIENIFNLFFKQIKMINFKNKQ